MDKHEIKARIEHEQIPSGQFIVAGSGILAALGMRPARDIDIVVDERLYDELLSRGWEKSGRDKILTHEIFEASREWPFGTQYRSFEALQQDVEVINGIAFLSLKNTREWKQASGRKKGFQDIKMIDDFIKNHA